jgi:hypothetical protein
MQYHAALQKNLTYRHWLGRQLAQRQVVALHLWERNDGTSSRKAVEAAIEEMVRASTTDQTKITPERLTEPDSICPK